MLLNDENRVIADGIARSRDLFGVTLLDVRDRLSNPDASFFAVWHRGKWVAGVRNEARIARLGVFGDPPACFLLLGESGDLRFLGGGQDSVETIPRGVNLPLTGLSQLDGSFYAFGMGRQLYKRQDSPVRWVPLHHRILNDDPSERVGFQVFVEARDKTFYGAGWGGEIWQYANAVWTNQDSPTNLILSDGVATANNEIVFCGRNGTIVRGTAGSWRLVGDGSINEDFWSVVEYDNCIYLSSRQGVYRLTDDELIPVEISVDQYRGSHYRLQVVDDRLFSFGERDIMLFDGSGWSRIDTE